MHEALIDTIFSVFKSCNAWKSDDENYDTVSLLDMIKVTYLAYVIIGMLLLPIGAACAVMLFIVRKLAEY